MKLSITIVNYHSEKPLRKFLQSLEAYRPEFLHEVIVVDNSQSREEMRDLQEDFGEWLQVIEVHQNLGFGAAQNKAVKKAKGEYILIANPDMEVTEASLKDLLDYGHDIKDFGIIGPQLIYPDGDVQESCRRFPRFSDLLVNRLRFLPGFNKRARSYLMEGRSLSKPTQVDWLVGAAMLMKRDRFEELGGFDERFFLFFEDTDLCRRAKEVGYDVWYFPESQFVHSRQRLSDSRIPGMWIFKKTFWIHLSSALKYFWKWRKTVRGKNSELNVEKAVQETES